MSYERLVFVKSRANFELRCQEEARLLELSKVTLLSYKF